MFVITKASWGGAQRYVYDLAVAAQDKGHEVTVACGTEGELSERLMTSHIPVLYVRGLGRDISPLADIRAFIELLRLTRAMRPDIIHANSSKAGLLATVAARLSGARHIIFTAHGWAFNEARPWWQKSIFAIFHAITIWCSDTVICVSEAVRRDASQRIPFLKNKFVVIRNGIAPTALLEKHAARMTLTERNTFPDFISGIWIGTLAELHPTKGLDTAIHAFADVAQQFQDTKLVLIGEGQDRNYLVSLVKEYNLYERVHFCGQVKNAASLLAAFDIFLFPSRSEALGFALLEAGNAHLPAIAAKVGGIPEVIEDGISGMLVPPNDVAGFSKALTTLIESPMLRKELGDVLAERVSSDFSRETMLSKTLALYEES
ncbi:MAG: glycosyltransferase family 4 protein [Candidatus Pacebacteria bacterium]|nr:glycosyltransferase family 4 protein [Candidatus Paceibacterota bacterium]